MSNQSNLIPDISMTSFFYVNVEMFSFIPSPNRDTDEVMSSRLSTSRL